MGRWWLLIVGLGAVVVVFLLSRRRASAASRPAGAGGDPDGAMVLDVEIRPEHKQAAQGLKDTFVRTAVPSGLTVDPALRQNVRDVKSLIDRDVVFVSSARPAAPPPDKPAPVGTASPQPMTTFVAAKPVADFFVRETVGVSR